MKKLYIFLFFVIQIGICNADLLIDSQSVSVDFENQEVLFAIVFNRVPDFYTMDEYGRTADNFQYYIDIDCSPVWYGSNFAETVIRGSEIATCGLIVLRNASGESADLTSGGWGEIIGLVPFQLDGTKLTFSASFQEIGDLDGQFSYALHLSSEYGCTSDWIYVSQVPEPATICLLAFGGIFLRKIKS